MNTKVYDITIKGNLVKTEGYKLFEQQVKEFDTEEEAKMYANDFARHKELEGYKQFTGRVHSEQVDDTLTDLNVRSADRPTRLSHTESNTFNLESENPSIEKLIKHGYKPVLTKREKVKTGDKPKTLLYSVQRPGFNHKKTGKNKRPKKTTNTTNTKKTKNTKNKKSTKLDIEKSLGF